MGHRTTRRRGQRQGTNRPSTFFIIALAIGLIVLIIIAVVIIRRPAVKQGSIEPSAAVMVVASAVSRWSADVPPAAAPRLVAR